MTVDEVRAKLRESVKEAGNAAEWARQKSVSPSYVNDVLNGGREPGAAILTAMGLERVVTYRVAAL